MLAFVDIMMKLICLQGKLFAKIEWPDSKKSGTEFFCLCREPDQFYGAEFLNDKSSNCRATSKFRDAFLSLAANAIEVFGRGLDAQALC